MFSVIRFLCSVWGRIVGKSNVRCFDCAALDGEGQCHGHQMTNEQRNLSISCGFWRPKKEIQSPAPK